MPGPLAKAPIADGRLQALLTRFAVTTPGVFLYHPGTRQVLPKLRAFMEHIKSRSHAANQVRSHVGKRGAGASTYAKLNMTSV